MITQMYELGMLLQYEQPTRYIVNSTEYDDRYPTPVLTAGKSFILGYTDETDNIFDELPVIIFDDFTTATQYVDFRFKVKSSAMKILHINTDLVLPKYIYYLLQTIRIEHSTHKRYWIQQFSKFKVDIPSIPEQEKIVSQIEESLSQLDSAVETLKKTKQQLEVYRQAVLKEAFEGLLTHSEKIKDDELINYIEKPRYGTSKKCTYSNSESMIPVYRIPNIEIKQMHIDKDDIKFAAFAESELDPIRLVKDDILIIRSNGSASLVGRAAIICQSDTDATFAGYLIRLRITNRIKLSPKYLLWYLQSSKARAYIEGKAKSTSGVHNINSTEISSLDLPIFEIDEQNKIVEAIESRISVYDTIEHTVNQSLQQAEALRQSILKQAFS